MLSHEDWKGNTGGTTWMQRTLIGFVGFVGIRLNYLIMGLFVAPLYMLFNHKGYTSIYHYFRRRHGFGWWKSFRYTYLNHYRFGQIIIDRFAAYAGCKFQFELEGNDVFLDLMSGDEGVIILSSHVGNYELAGYSFAATEKRYNAVVFSGETKTVMENRNRMLSKNNIKMIPVSEDMSHVFLMNAALADGEAVSIPGDRIFGSRKSVVCDFMGGQASFPLGPFSLAVQREAPTMAIFVMKESAYKYHVFIRKITTDETVHLDKITRISKIAQSFAKELEDILQRYPEQWFNYYEFWHDGPNQS